MPDLRERFLARHVLAQVIAEALPVVGRYPIIRHTEGALNNCISSTRIAKLVCDHYGVPSRPVPCTLLAWNRPVKERMDREGGGGSAFRLPESAEELERWADEDGSRFSGAGIGDAVTAADTYPGHVVLVVNEEWVVDMSADQCQKPQYGILPEPVTFPAAPFLRPGEWFPLWHEGAGTGMAYSYRPDKPPFEDTPAWLDPPEEFATVLAEIIEELDALDPQTIIRGSVWA